MVGLLEEVLKARRTVSVRASAACRRRSRDEVPRHRHHSTHEPSDPSWLERSQRDRLLVRAISRVKILHIAEPLDETSLVRLLSFFDRLIKFCLRQMSHQKITLIFLYCCLEVSRGLKSFADYSSNSRDAILTTDSGKLSATTR